MTDISENIEENELTAENPEIDSTTKKTTGLKLDPSIFIALFAVLISTVSAFISLKEANIMRKQQEILAEQQEASVWPYIETVEYADYDGDDTSVEYSFIIKNKGIGPAIIDSVKYMLDDKPIKLWELSEELAKKFPSAEILGLRNQTLEFNVLAPGEGQNVVGIKIITKENPQATTEEIINSFDFHLEYCYCSVYGKCWKVKNTDEIELSTDCVFRENIR